MLNCGKSKRESAAPLSNEVPTQTNYSLCSTVLAARRRCLRPSAQSRRSASTSPATATAGPSQTPTCRS